MRVTIGGEENDFCLSDEILIRDIADIGATSAELSRLSPIMKSWPSGTTKTCVLFRSFLRIALENVVADSVGQGFAELGNVMYLYGSQNAR